MSLLGFLLVFLASTLGSIQGCDGKELPVPISDVLERLIDLEKRLLIQEMKNMDLEKRLLEQETLNKIQGEIIRNMSSCDCTTKEKTTTYVGNSRKTFSNDPFDGYGYTATQDQNFSEQNTSYGRLNNGLSLRSNRTIRGHLIIKPGLTDSTSKVKRITTHTGGVAFYAYMSKIEYTVGHHQTFVFDQVVTNVGGNYNRHTGAFTSPSHGIYVFSWTLFCQMGGHFVSEIVSNSNAVGALFCSAEGAPNIKHITGVVVLEVNQGDVVFIRTHPTEGLSQGVYSSTMYRSSFTGWKLF